MYVKKGFVGSGWHRIELCWVRGRELSFRRSAQSGTTCQVSQVTHCTQNGQRSRLGAEARGRENRESGPRIQASHLPPPTPPFSSSRASLRVLRVKEHHQQSADVARTGDNEGVGSSREESQVADELPSRGDARRERESIESSFVLFVKGGDRAGNQVYHTIMGVAKRQTRGETRNTHETSRDRRMCAATANGPLLLLGAIDICRVLRNLLLRSPDDAERPCMRMAAEGSHGALIVIRHEHQSRQTSAWSRRRFQLGLDPLWNIGGRQA